MWFSSLVPHHYAKESFEEAIACAEKRAALQRFRRCSLFGIKVSAEWDNIREDPRVAEILRRAKYAV